MSYPVEINKSYNLNINLENNKIINGTTIIPPKVKFNKITKDDEAYYIYWNNIDSLYFEWTLKSDESIFYEVGSKPSYANFARINKRNIYKNIKYYLEVYTFDKNLSDYYSKEKDRFGIDKFYGVFGSKTKTIIDVNFDF
ncbi:MAG: hypothetical protein CR986_03330 [Ignavibacteriae bacterium]|nr:MAG: hypothetical protein CR986_03330 [Ignavibacteriota bacterium]